MSGIEVVGLVLGVLPLCISALEHYEKGLGPVTAMVKYRRELARYRCRLAVQYALYSQTIEYLLTPIVEEDQLESMFAQDFGELWKQPDIAGRLEDHLGSVHEAYHYTLMDIQEVIEELVAMLDIERQGQSVPVHLESLLAAHPRKGKIDRDTRTFTTLYEFKTRLKFSLKSVRVDPLLKKLEEYNEQLERFTEKSKKLEKARTKTRSGKGQNLAFATPLHQVQQSASKLHRVLKGAWTCPQHAGYGMNLKLEHRLLPLSGRASDKDDSGSDGICFSICLPASCAARAWQDVEIHVLGDSSAISKEAHSAPQSLTRVKFDMPAARARVDSFQDLAVIKSLCAALERTQKTQACLGLCLDQEERLLGDYPVSRSASLHSITNSRSAVTLNELLAAPQTGTNRRRRVFTSKQSYVIALTVASSFLQLYATPFSQSGWCSDDIVFLRDEIQSRSIDIETLYVTQTYATSPDSIKTMQAVQIRDDHCALLNLGIILLEVFFKEPLSQHREAGDGGADQSFADLKAARRWVQEDKEDMTAAFHQAISYCIGCFANPNVDLSDAAFRQQIVDQVVIPLRDEMKLWQA
ncbi:hypothetical protein MBLNU459_g0447t1 [Dothideomycetes sp. NU459]